MAALELLLGLLGSPGTGTGEHTVAEVHPRVVPGLQTSYRPHWTLGGGCCRPGEYWAPHWH